MSIWMDLYDDRSERIQYDFHEYPMYLRRGRLSNYPNYAAANHWHDDIELILVLDGEMTYSVNGELQTLRAGEGILVNTRQMHYGFSQEERECEFLCVLLHPMLLCTSLQTEREFVLPLLQNTAVPFVFLEPGQAWQRQILARIRQMYECRERAAAPLRIQSMFLELWSLLWERLPAPEQAETESAELTIIKNMTGYIQKHYNHRLTLAQIAAAGAVGQSKCCKLFGKYFHQTPIVYLNRYRLDKSLELLRGSDLPVTEVAYRVGFGGASYYTETFRRWLGMSPTEFRRREQSIESRGRGRIRELHMESEHRQPPCR